MQTIRVKNSTIHIGESYENLKDYLPNAQIIVLTDENVYAYYSSFINTFQHIVIPAGETSKTGQTVTTIVAELLDKGADRHTFLLGFGGGVVTDITGFVASIFMRGIRFGFVATSLLAQVDASLGGKNGINFCGYKNILGTFNSPYFVICDANLLKTLPRKELRSGFGEIIKHALIQDASFLSYLSVNSVDLLNLNARKIADVIRRAIIIKAEIVQKDWRENDERKKLNFGHTLGHAIENNSTSIHGEAISAGMFWAAKWSMKKGYLQEKDVLQIKEILEKFQLPIVHSVAPDVLAAFIQKDKKKEGTSIDFVFLKAIGVAQVIRLPIQNLVEAIKEV